MLTPQRRRERTRGAALHAGAAAGARRASLILCAATTSSGQTPQAPSWASSQAASWHARSNNSKHARTFVQNDSLCYLRSFFDPYTFNEIREETASLRPFLRREKNGTAVDRMGMYMKVRPRNTPVTRTRISKSACVRPEAEPTTPACSRTPRAREPSPTRRWPSVCRRSWARTSTCPSTRCAMPRRCTFLLESRWNRLDRPPSGPTLCGCSAYTAIVRRRSVTENCAAPPRILFWFPSPKGRHRLRPLSPPPTAGVSAVPAQLLYGLAQGRDALRPAAVR